jgi:SsrA-binding protein
MRTAQKKVEIKNKKAWYEYFLLEEFTAGMVLTGSEIKSIREGKASIAEAYCFLDKGELFIRNMHITEYHHGGYSNHDPKRDRKLLLTRRELKKLTVKTVEKGLTIIPLLLFISEKGHAKVKISIARGKKFFDKRDSIKSKDIERDSHREL